MFCFLFLASESSNYLYDHLLANEKINLSKTSRSMWMMTFSPERLEEINLLVNQFSCSSDICSAFITKDLV